MFKSELRFCGFVLVNAILIGLFILTCAMYLLVCVHM